MWNEIRTTVQQEFSDIGNAEDLTRICLRLSVALALGALLGYERESVGASAGLRTHMLVALGMAASMGLEATAVVGALFGWIVLFLLRKLQG